LINQGVSIIGYFGHSSANTLAFNLSDPSVYTNQGKYPFFNISGCSAGNYYIFDPNRLNNVLTISEKYVLADQRGSIAFLGDTHLGIPPFLNIYNDLNTIINADPTVQMNITIYSDPNGQNVVLNKVATNINYTYPYDNIINSVVTSYSGRLSIIFNDGSMFQISDDSETSNWYSLNGLPIQGLT
jgi:hypothetical protein